MIRRKIALAATGLVVAAGLLSACGDSSDAADSASAVANSETTNIRYLGSGGGGYVVFPELAQQLGYLDGLTLENVGATTGGPAQIQAVATDQIDFGGPFNSSIIAAREAGASIKAVIGYLGTNELSPSGYFTLEGSPIKTARDLLGKKVALNTLGAAQEAFLDEYLLENGVTGDELKDVTRVILPPANFELALRKQQVDLVPFSSPAQKVAEKQGGITQLFSAYDLLGDFTQASYVMRENFLESNPTTAQKFVSGTGKAIAWAQSHTPKEVVDEYGKWLTAHNRAEEIPLLGFWNTSGIANAGGAISPSEFSTWINWLEQKGDIAKGSIKVDDVYTNEFNVPYGQNIVPASEAKVE